MLELGLYLTHISFTSVLSQKTFWIAYTDSHHLSLFTQGFTPFRRIPQQGIIQGMSNIKWT